MRILVFTFLVIITVFAITSCSNSNDIPSYCPFTPFFEDRSLLYGETLTFIVPSSDPIRLQRRQRYISSFNREWRDYNVSVRLRVVDDDTPEHSIFQQVVSVEMMAGSLDALILLEEGFSDGRRGIDWRNPSISMFFADMWPVLNADPDFHEDNFIVNIFDALTLSDDSLRVIPTAVNVSYFSANRTIPGLVNAFSTFDFVTIEDLHKLHNKFAVYDSFYMFLGYSPVRIAPIIAHEFLDLSNRTARFNSSEFADMLTHSLKMTNLRPNNTMFGMWYVTHGIVEPELLHAAKYAFRRSIPLVHIYELLLLEGHESLFSTPVPMTNNQGKLLIDPFNPFALSVTSTYAQRVLAWEFIKHMSSCERVDEQPFYSQVMSIYRSSLHRLIYWTVARWFPGVAAWCPMGLRYRSAQNTGFNLAVTQDEAIEALICFHENLAQMPMVLNHFMTRPMLYAIESNVGSLRDGLLLPSQAAANIQNTVMLILLEGN